MNYESHYQAKLAAIDDANLRRGLVPRPGVGGKIGDANDRQFNFSSNDYLDLAGDARVKAAAAKAAETYGAGATSSRLMAGSLALHHTLEERLAALVRQEGALVFPAGFQMNAGVLAALFDHEWTIYSDALNHASLIDGCRLARARVQIYPHGDAGTLEALIDRDTGLKVILTESIFSMDGDLAPIERLAEIACQSGAMLVVDEAHAIGIHGAGGGLCVDRNIRPDVTLGTLGKSLGSAGGFFAGSSLLRDVMVNTARSFIFSTGLNPVSTAAAIRSAEIVSDNSKLGVELLRRADLFRASLRSSGLEVPHDESPIVPIVLGSNNSALEAARALEAKGIIATAIRPPTVPEGTSRLRLSVTLAHTDDDLARVAQAVGEVAAPLAVRA